MIKKTIYITALIILGFGNLFSQSKTEIIENKIKSVTIYEDRQEKNESEKIESITVFDIIGNVIEEKEFNNEGKLKKHIKYTYDDQSRKIKEVELNEDGKILGSIEYKYEGNLRKERITYDEKGRIKNKKRYVYEKHN